LFRTRGEANQAFYRAKILLEAWEGALRVRGHSEAQLCGAYLPAVKLHLRQAYGWFLLHVSGVDQVALPRLPCSTEDLPAPEPGKQWAPELREFQLLERDGWICELLQDDLPRATTAELPGILGSDRSSQDRGSAARWVQSLGDLMLRMDDSLAEC
jgi:hypothetical protein